MRNDRIYIFLCVKHCFKFLYLKMCQWAYIENTLFSKNGDDPIGAQCNAYLSEKGRIRHGNENRLFLRGSDQNQITPSGLSALHICQNKALKRKAAIFEGFRSEPKHPIGAQCTAYLSQNSRIRPGKKNSYF